MRISVIIPAYNEACNIAKLIVHLRNNDKKKKINEIIVVDGHSTDDTAALAQKAGAIIITAHKKSKAIQMNCGAKMASGDILYFLHADSFPPPDFSDDIIDAVKNGIHSGCYRLFFDHDHWFLKLNCWFTRFNINAFRFGDQSLFVMKKCFNDIGGFNEELLLMEDQDIISRIKSSYKFTIFKREITSSARKYLDNGIFQLQVIFFILYILYRLGYPQDYLIKLYRSWIIQDKI